MITQKQYLQRKIDASRFYDSDAFYMGLAEALCEKWEADTSYPLGGHENQAARQEVVLNLVGYMMDVVADLGLWRAFTLHCRNLYNRPVPFYSNENYIDYELNQADVRFMTWYSLCFLGEPGDAPLYPFDPDVMALADTFYEIMEESYEDAPLPEGMLKTKGLEMHDPDDADNIQTLGQWLFWSSYLMVPCFKSNMAMIYAQAKPDDKRSLLQVMGEAQMELPTGPLALYLREWIWLIIEGKMPPQPNRKKKPEEHPYFKPFIKANDGHRIAFFNDYRKLNIFLGKALGWDPESDNLPQLKKSEDFTLLANPEKGLLVGRDVARCLNSALNPFYNKEYAVANDFRLLIQRGRCPIDLTLYALDNNMLNDLLWPEQQDSGVCVVENADFIARCFLQQYYRAV